MGGSSGSVRLPCDKAEVVIYHEGKKTTYTLDVQTAAEIFYTNFYREYSMDGWTLLRERIGGQYRFELTSTSLSAATDVD